MSIDFATVKTWEIPQGIVSQVTDASGRVLWTAIQKARVTITSQWNGMDGDTARITVNSSMPFAPDPTNPSYKTKTWTVSVADEPNCTIEIPVGSTIECYVSRDKENAESCIRLNGVKILDEGIYTYTVKTNVTIAVEDKYSQGDFGMIRIVETGEIEVGPAILEVEKITSNTYAGETLYENEQFILLDIYPKTNGTVQITYGGLTKTITDTSGAEEPNAQQVFFGTFNGVSDSVATPASGTLTIEGDYYAFACSSYKKASKVTGHCWCVTSIVDFGNTIVIPYSAFGTIMDGSCTFETVTIRDNIIKIGDYAFVSCTAIKTVTIGKNVAEIGNGAFFVGNDSNKQSSLTSIKMLSSVPPVLISGSGSDGTINYFNFGNLSFSSCVLEEIIVPKGCGNAYKTATGWTYYADLIVEAT